MLSLVGLAACSDGDVTGLDGAFELAAVTQAPQANASAISQPAKSVRTAFSYSGELTKGGFVRGQVPSNTVSAMLGEQALEIASDGAFFAAFDRDAGDTITLTATLSNGDRVAEVLTLSDREWQIQRVNVARRKLRDPEAYWRAREPEHNAIVAARAIETDAQGWRQDFIWPVTGRISGAFGNQRIYRGEPGGYHSGVDIASPTGTPFVAPADGVVVLARTGFSLEGGLIIIDHGGGLNSAYLHAHRIHVEEGQAVKQGEHIGDVGSTGRSTGPHLHWGLKWNDARFDPILLAGPMP
ncbi:MAG: M23 family metallopeptidase [Pseudomonadota bacterium]